MHGCLSALTPKKGIREDNSLGTVRFSPVCGCGVPVENYKGEHVVRGEKVRRASPPTLFHTIMDFIPTLKLEPQLRSATFPGLCYRSCGL